jgi:bacillithiol biosynthesis deacetylase BshB1
MAKRESQQLGAGCDFMAIGAHADDVEIHAGGTVLKLVAAGRKGVIVDMTDASAGTRGTPEIRAKEANAAAKKLGVMRMNLGLADGRLRVDEESELALVAAIRLHRPRVIFTHDFSEEHPDHVVTAQLVKAACFRAGLAKLSAPGEPWRPGRLFHFLGHESGRPWFGVDITEHWKGKLAAIGCFRSQFHHAGASSLKGKTDISTPAFLEQLEIKNRYFGSRIKRRYAEAFTGEEAPEVVDPTELGWARFP